jgi:hypothetical protein
MTFILIVQIRGKILYVVVANAGVTNDTASPFRGAPRRVESVPQRAGQAFCGCRNRPVFPRRSQDVKGSDENRADNDRWSPAAFARYGAHIGSSRASGLEAWEINNPLRTRRNVADCLERAQAA